MKPCHEVILAQQAIHRTVGQQQFQSGQLKRLRVSRVTITLPTRSICTFKRGGWQVQFTEADLKTPLPRKLTFSDPEKIRELATRREAWGTSEARQILEHAIETGRAVST